MAPKAWVNSCEFIRLFFMHLTNKFCLSSIFFNI
jgi:hypothetical protein